MVFGLFSCREDIVIDLEEGNPLVGVEGSFTDEYKRHEVILSYTSDFYQADAIRMVCGAKVAVTDGVERFHILSRRIGQGIISRIRWLEKRTRFTA